MLPQGLSLLYLLLYALYWSYGDARIIAHTTTNGFASPAWHSCYDAEPHSHSSHRMCLHVCGVPCAGQISHVRAAPQCRVLQRRFPTSSCELAADIALEIVNVRGELFYYSAM